MAVIVNTPVLASYSVPARVEHTNNIGFLGHALGNPRSFNYLSRTSISTVRTPQRGREVCSANFQVPTASLLIQALHQAFAAHVPFSLSPDVLWYLIVHEIAQHVQQNPSEHSGLFTNHPGVRQTISIPDVFLRSHTPSDWAVSLVRGPLEAYIGEKTMGLFLPRFSTSGAESEMATMVALMDVASPYYDYRMYTLCGIPQIRLEGTTADWLLLYKQTERLARLFKGLRGYFADLLPVLQIIAETVNGARPKQEFWYSIYKYSSDSGTPYITGWITAFFAYFQTRKGPELRPRFDWRRPYSGWRAFKIERLPAHISHVSCSYVYNGREINMKFGAGLTGVDYDGTFLSPRLGVAVATM